MGASPSTMGASPSAMSASPSNMGAGQAQTPEEDILSMSMEFES
jgi:hypothetical protein